MSIVEVTRLCMEPVECYSVVDTENWHTLPRTGTRSWTRSSSTFYRFLMSESPHGWREQHCLSHKDLSSLVKIQLNSTLWWTSVFSASGMFLHDRRHMSVNFAFFVRTFIYLLYWFQLLPDRRSWCSSDLSCLHDYMLLAETSKPGKQIFILQ